MFKKKKIKKYKNPKNILNYISYFGFFIIFVLLLIILGKNINFDIYGNTLNKLKEEVALKEKDESYFSDKQARIKKELDSKKQNILIIGRGGYGNDAPELTDSLILLSYYKEKQHISTLSIPRDLYVEYGDKYKNGKKIDGKINGLYAYYLTKFQNKEKAIEKLKQKIEEITNEEIDYYINIDFNGFSKLVNSIDGVTVNVKRNIYDENYPDKNYGFQIFNISKGVKTIYGETALKYVRSRHNSGGDFGRSERQQQVLKAIKEKVLSSEYLTNPSKIKDLYNIFQKHIITDIGIIDFTKIAGNIKLQKKLFFYSSTLNASCIKEDECIKGGFLFYPQRNFFGGQSVLLSGNSTYKNLGDYDEIRKYSGIVFNSPSLFKENFKISIFSNLQNKEKAKKLRQELKMYGLNINILERIGNIPDYKPEENKKILKNEITLKEYNELKAISTEKNIYNNKIANGIEKESNNESTKIIINGVDINSNTIKFLKEHLNLDKKDIVYNIEGPKYAKDKNTNIEILYKN